MATREHPKWNDDDKIVRYTLGRTQWGQALYNKQAGWRFWIGLLPLSLFASTHPCNRVPTLLTLRLRILILAFFAVGMGSARCEAFISPGLCTDEFVTYFVQVQAPDGAPADSVAVTVRNANTGQVYDVCASVNCQRTPPGQYYIFHDGLDASSDGSHVRVAGEKGDLGFRANYVFRAGERHVQKVAGPDQVTLRR